MIIDKLKPGVRYLLRTLRLTPMHRVLRRLKWYGINPKTLNALEVFGCDGEHLTRDIASVVAKLEIWEFGPEYEAILKRRFPKSEIKITDSYVEIERTPRKYGLVVVDNHVGVISNHYEHFDMFPAIFRVLNDPAIIILNVLSKIQQKDSEWLTQRQLFYKAANPARITFDEIENTYRNLAKENGWTVEQIFFERRWSFDLSDPLCYYGALKLKCS